MIAVATDTVPLPPILRERLIRLDMNQPAQVLVGLQVYIGHVQTVARYTGGHLKPAWLLHGEI
jgi:hypothetical protein